MIPTSLTIYPESFMAIAATVSCKVVMSNKHRNIVIVTESTKKVKIKERIVLSEIQLRNTSPATSNNNT